MSSVVRPITYYWEWESTRITAVYENFEPADILRLMSTLLFCRPLVHVIDVLGSSDGSVNTVSLERLRGKDGAMQACLLLFIFPCFRHDRRGS